jgi:hypothetical protein
MTAPAQPAQHAPSRPARRGPVLIALMTAMALAGSALTVVAALTIVAVLLLMPRRFDVRPGAAATTGPG